MGSRHYKNLTSAITLIAIGCIFLLNTTGLLDWGIWEYILKFWPIILILIGLRIMMPDNRTTEIVIASIYLLIIAYIIISAYDYNVGQTIPFFTNTLNNCIFNGCHLN